MRVIDKDSGEEFELDSTDELSEDLRRYHEAECAHPETQIRSTVVSGGAIHFREQCQLCGELLPQAIARRLVPPGCPSMDEILLNRRREERSSNTKKLFRNMSGSKKRKGLSGGQNTTHIS